MDIVLTTVGEITEDISVRQESRTSDHKMIRFTLTIPESATGICNIRELNFQRAVFHAMLFALKQFEGLAGYNVKTPCSLFKTDYTLPQ